MRQQEDAIRKLSVELTQIFRRKLGKEPDSELIKAEAENLVAKFGPIGALKEIFS